MISWNISKRNLKLMADISASSWHHSQGKVDKLIIIIIIIIIITIIIIIIIIIIIFCYGKR